MYLRYGMLAEYVGPGEGGTKNVIGIFDMVAGPQFPLRHKRMMLFVRIEGHLSEAGTHTLAISFVDADYNRLGGPPEMSLELQPEGRPVPDAPIASEVVLDIQALEIPAPGDYEFAVLVDGRHIGAVPLYARERSAPPAAPAQPPVPE